MGKQVWRVGVVLLGGLMALLLSGTTAANAATPSVCCYVPPPTYKVVNVSTYENFVDYSRRVGLCTPSAGGTCSITRETSVSTTVQVSLSATQGVVAGQLGFSLTRGSSTSVTCNSPKMTSSQWYSAYAVGTRKYYKIQKWQGDGLHAPKLIATSGTLAAWQPYSYPAISCSVSG